MSDTHLNTPQHHTSDIIVNPATTPTKPIHSIHNTNNNDNSEIVCSDNIEKKAITDDGETITVTLEIPHYTPPPDKLNYCCNSEMIQNKEDKQYDVSMCTDISSVNERKRKFDEISNTHPKENVEDEPIVTRDIPRYTASLSNNINHDTTTINNNNNNIYNNHSNTNNIHIPHNDNEKNENDNTSKSHSVTTNDDNNINQNIKTFQHIESDQHDNIGQNTQENTEANTASAHVNSTDTEKMPQFAFNTSAVVDEDNIECGPQCTFRTNEMLIRAVDELTVRDKRLIFSMMRNNVDVTGDQHIDKVCSVSEHCFMPQFSLTMGQYATFYTLLDKKKRRTKT